MGTEREQRKFYIIYEGKIHHEVGYSCGSDSPDHWWFPMLGVTLRHGGAAFDTMEEARDKLLAKLKAERDGISESIKEVKARYGGG